MAEELRKLDKEADNFIQTLKLGAGIDLGGKIVSSLGAVPGLFSDAVRRGVEFNTSLADSEVAIANVVKQFAGLNDEAAKAEAAKAIQKIIEVEPKAAGSLRDLTGGLMATVGSAQAAGISIEQNVDLVGRFANALANLNIPTEQLNQEMRAIFSGNITPDAAVAKTLQITSADVERAKQAGNLYDYLVKKVGSLGEAGDTFAVKWSSLQSSIDKGLGVMAQSTTQQLAAIADALQKEIAKPETLEALRTMGVEIGHLVEDAGALVSWLVKNADTLALVARVTGTVVVALAALKLRDLVAGLGLKAAAWMRSTAAVQANTAALRENAAAQAGAVRGPAGGAGMLGRAGTLLGSAAGVAVAVGAANQLGQQLNDYRVQGEINANNAGSQDAQRRLNAMYQLITAAKTEEEQLKAKATLMKELLAVQNEYAAAVAKHSSSTSLFNDTEDARRVQNLEALLSTLNVYKDAWAKLAGSQAKADAERQKKAMELTAEERQQLDILKEEVAIMELRAAGYEDVAREAQKNLDIEKQVIALRKANPKLNDATARDLVSRGMNAKEMEAAKAAAEDLRKTLEAPTGYAPWDLEAQQKRAAELSGKFANMTGNAAPGENATLEEWKAAAGGNAEALKLANEIAQVWQEISETRTKIAAEANEQHLADAEMAKRYQDAKKDLEIELGIQAALLRNDKERVRELERQRDIERTKNALIAEGYGIAAAGAAAEKLANAKKAVEDKETAKRKTDAELKLKLEEAKATRSKRDDKAVEDTIFKREKRQEFLDAGFSPAEADKLTARAMAARDRQRIREEGRIGGTALRSSRDTLGGGVDNLAALKTPLGEQIAQAGGATGTAKAGVPGAKDAGSKELADAAAAATAMAGEVKAAAAALKAALNETKKELATLKAEVTQLASAETGR